MSKTGWRHRFLKGRERNEGIVLPGHAIFDMLGMEVYMPRLIGIICLLLSAGVWAASDTQVFKLFHKKQWGEALMRSEQFQQKNPDDQQAKFVLGVAQMYNGNLVQARAVFEELREKNPNVAALHNNLGVILLAEGKVSDARKMFVETLRLDSRHTNARKNMALLGGTTGKISVTNANVDKRGLEFTVPIPGSERRMREVEGESSTLEQSTAAPVEVKPTQSNPGVIGSAKENVVVSKRENNPFNEEVKRQVFDALNQWVGSWAAQDVDTYLGMYSPDFVPSNGRTRAEWEQQRRVRISNKNQIRIEAVDVVLEVGSSTAVVATFQQHYRADVLNEISNKMLVFIRDSETSTAWKIVDERTGY